MARIRILLLFLSLALTIGAHPMGNFSVNHYARISLSEHGSTLTYVLDFAEIPTFELLQQWNLDAKDSAGLEIKARTEAGNWLKNLSLEGNGNQVIPVLRTVRVTVQDGAGGMPILRIATISKLALSSGKVEYEDRNYPGRTGWKEIVIRAGKGAELVSASEGGKDLSEELTKYPIDSSIVPPQQLKASLDWKVQPPLTVRVSKEPVEKEQPTVSRTEPAAKLFANQQPTAQGTVVKGDFLSHLLRKRELGFGFIVLGLLVAFGLGAMHALSPGHGKTIVAAYLVGSRGTIRHAMFLGSTVTLTHTMSVFLLGLGVLFFERYIVPDRIIPWLGAVSGLSIVFIGVLLLYRRVKAFLPVRSEGANAHPHPHHHEHPHIHNHGHDHSHVHPHIHSHGHSHGTHTHSHGGRPHSHMPDGEITLSSLIALGVSGGLVPCPSALVLMLSAIALGHAGIGLMLLVGFSCGLAVVLMGIGVLVIYAKQLIPQRPGLTSHPFFRLIPVLSAVVVVCLGLGMTAVSLGWVQPGKFGI
jgi:nickel/cobalt exporter